MRAMRPFQLSCTTVVALTALCLHSGASAFTMTKQEKALLPPQYCTYTNSSPEAIRQPEIYQAQLNRYGEGWSHIHHYCRSIVYFMRFSRYGLTPVKRAEVADRAIAEIDYTINNSPPEFPLMPMLLLRKAEYLYTFNRKRDAIQHLVDSLESIPDFPEGYALLAFYLKQTGNPTEAERVISRGREVVKDKAALDQAIIRYDKLR